MMIKTATLFLALGSIVAAASNTAEIASTNEDWDYQVVAEPRSAEDEGRELQSTDASCITVRMVGDSNASRNSVVLKNMRTGRDIYRNEDLSPGRVDSPRSPCPTAPVGDLLKLTVNAPRGYSSTAFHALFVGRARLARIAGGAMDGTYEMCFRLINASPGYEPANCQSATEADENASGSTVGAPPDLPSNEIAFQSRMGCPSGQKMVRVDFESDNWNENEWYIKKKNSNQRVMECNYDSGNDYCLTQDVTRCLPADEYELVMRDGAGDRCGKFKFYMENSQRQWKELVGACKVGRTMSWHFHTKNVSMTQREVEWLEAHNERRQKYWYNGSTIKNNGNPHYVPQVWDPELAAAATEYAEELLDGCESDEMLHDPSRNGQGENMAKNRGTPGTDYGSQPAPDRILNRFVEFELNWPFGRRYHMTQVLWQASHYVGCGDAFREYRVNGAVKHCHTQVCRYTAPGNCGINRSNDFRQMMKSFDELNCGGDNRYPPSGMYTM
mmetsp:Transcript_17498/g.27437  ORF Transcript_17498/g.27437 Transcript_17498/m.27437 type:complete len:499 (-) Transcript_17498:152-1648(-)